MQLIAYSRAKHTAGHRVPVQGDREVLNSHLQFNMTTQQVHSKLSTAADCSLEGTSVYILSNSDESTYLFRFRQLVIPSFFHRKGF